MAFTTGTATDWIDLALKLKDWLTVTAGWTLLEWAPGNVNTGGMVLKVRGPGAGVDKQTFVNIRSVHDDTVPHYVWEIRGAIGYSAAAPWGSQLGESSQSYFSLWKNAITYWFYANDRRFIVVAKVGTVYISMYAGFMLPWATPVEYPFPLYICGSDGVPRPYNNTNCAHRFFIDPGGYALEGVGNDFGSGKIRKPDGTWKRVMNSVSANANDWQHYSGSSTVTECPVLWPIGLRGGYGGGTNYYWSGTGNSGIVDDPGAVNTMVPTAQNERMLFPCLVMQGAEPGGFGALDGVYFPCGSGLSPEQTATLGGRTFRFFNNIHRSSGNDWMAIEEI